MPYECVGQPGIPWDPRALRVVEVIPCELKVPEVDEDSDTHSQRAGSLERLPGELSPDSLDPVEGVYHDHTTK